MVSKRLSIFGLISAAAIVSGVLVGCGGSGASVSGDSPVVAATGGVPVTTGAPTTNVATSTTPQQVQVTTASGTIGAPGTTPAVVPPGQPAITSGTTVGVVPANIPFINGLGFGPSAHRAPTAHPLNISYDQGVTWNWTGVNVNADGSLDGYLIVAAGTRFYLQAVGPFVIISQSGFTSHQLTMRQLIFGIVVDANGIASVPSGLTMRLPANGGTTANGNFVNVTYPTPDFAAGSASLTVTGLSSGTKVQNKAVINGQVNFADPAADAKDGVPSGGVNTITFLYNTAQ